jgi:archaellum biogenesis ATPase FlaH
MMVSVNIPVQNEIFTKLAQFSWVNWSDVGREEANKRRIFEDYRKNKTISDEDIIFCESIDWHPVDELPMKPEYVKKLKKIIKGKHRSMTLDELDKLIKD